MTRKTYVAAIKDALAEEMRRDSNVFLIGEDVKLGVFAGTPSVSARARNKPAEGHSPRALVRTVSRSFADSSSKPGRLVGFGHLRP